MSSLKDVLDLKPNKGLLNAKFQCYKLSLKKLRYEEKQLQNCVSGVPLKLDNYSYISFKLHCFHNHLISDLYSESTYFIDENYNLQELNEGELRSLQLLHTDEIGRLYNASLVFPSDNYALATDGNSKTCLFIFQTGCRKSTTVIDWMLEDRMELYKLREELPSSFILLDARMNGQCINVVIACVCERDESEGCNKSKTELFALVLCQDDCKKWIISSCDAANTESVVDFCYYGPECLYVACSKPLVPAAGQQVDGNVIREAGTESCKVVTEEGVAGTTPAFNVGQLEACDNAPMEESWLHAVGEKWQVLRRVYLGGHQKLFNVRLMQGEVPSLCLRRDVDGLLWKPVYDSPEGCQHTHTLNALGYIMASKRWKFATCPDASYCVIAEEKRNVFVYKTENLKCEFGEQFVVTLSEGREEIMGLQAKGNKFFILTESRLYTYLLNDGSTAE